MHAGTLSTAGAGRLRALALRVLHVCAVPACGVEAAACGTAQLTFSTWTRSMGGEEPRLR